MLRQTCQDFEVILLDDCSIDESRSILSEYVDDPRVRIEFNAVNSGSTFKQWNKGVRLARGEYVWLAESDDYADERLLERLVAVLDADPTVMFAYCRSWRVTEDDQEWIRGLVSGILWRRGDGRRTFLRTVLRNAETASCIPILCRPQCRCFPESLLQRVGGPDETLRLCGDLEALDSMVLQGRDRLTWRAAQLSSVSRR